MPSIADLAGAAGTAQGRAAGQTFTAGDAISRVTGMAGNALMTRYQQQQKVQDSTAAVDEWTKGGLLKDPQEIALFHGMAIAGMDKDKMGVLLDHHLTEKTKNQIDAAKVSLEERKAVGYDQQGPAPTDTAGNEVEGPPQGVHVPGTIETNANRAAAYRANVGSMAERRTAQTDQGLIKIDQTDTRLAQTADRNAAVESTAQGNLAERTRHNTAMEANTKDRNVQTADHEQFMRDHADRMFNLHAAIADAKTPGSADVLLPDATAAVKSAQSHLQSAKAVVQSLQFSNDKAARSDAMLKLSQSQSAYDAAVAAEGRIKSQSVQGRRDKANGMPGSPRDKAARSSAAASAKQTFQQKHGREPDPTNQDDVTEMWDIAHGGGQ